MCTNKILIIGRGNAGSRYGDILKNYYPNISFQYHDRINFKSYRKVIIASANSNHLNDLINCCKNSRVVMIEKPLITNYNDLQLLQGEIQSKSIFTGDQFYYSKGLRYIKELIDTNIDKKASIKIIYHDDINNITKSNPNSYYFCKSTGEILYTLSHVYFVVSFLASYSSLNLFSINYDKFIFQGKNIYKRFESKWYNNNHEYIAETNVSKNNLSFNVIIDCQGKKYNLDLIKGILYKDSLELINFNQSRYDLIRCCIDQFISERNNNQYLLSINSLSLIWKILEKI